MPIVDHSTFVPHAFLTNAHFQTIIPSFFAHLEPVNYTREIFDTPNQDQIAIDWSQVGSDRLVIINHGLCGHSHRHYVRSFVKAFNDAGWDCMAWNFRGISEDDFLNPKLDFTTNNSSDELQWLIDHAIQKYRYRKIALTGFSMGGNLALLYFGRATSDIPAQVVAGAVVCAVSDLFASEDKVNLPKHKIYANHLVGKLLESITRKHEQFPDQVNLDLVKNIRTFADFDDAYTAPMLGFKNHSDYWTVASAANYYLNIDRPTLMIAPQNDPFLDGGCYPVEIAEKSKDLFLEMPESGGHCGFISAGNAPGWWPAKRTTEFLKPFMA